MDFRKYISKDFNDQCCDKMEVIHGLLHNFAQRIYVDKAAAGTILAIKMVISLVMTILDR